MAIYKLLSHSYDLEPNINPKWRDSFEAYEDYLEKKEKKMEKVLYEIARDNREGLGEWEMVIKSLGEILFVKKGKAQKVVPYTIGVQYKENGTVYHYFNESRNLKVDDFFINTTPVAVGCQYQIGRVVAVDTKNEEAKSEIKYFKKL